MNELSVNKEVGTTAETLTHNVASKLELTGKPWTQSPPHFQDRRRHKTKQSKTKHTNKQNTAYSEFTAYCPGSQIPNDSLMKCPQFSLCLR